MTDDRPVFENNPVGKLFNRGDSVCPMTSEEQLKRYGSSR